MIYISGSYNINLNLSLNLNYMNLKILLIIICMGLIAACSQSLPVNQQELTDGDIETFYTGSVGVNIFIFDSPYKSPVLSYKIYCSGDDPKHDPFNWTLKGSDNGKNWFVVDERSNQMFYSRFQEIICEVRNPDNYKRYMLEVISANEKDVLKVSEVMFSDKNLLKAWKPFNYPEVNFNIEEPNAEGSKLYGQLVQNPDEYIKYHTMKVAEILYFSAEDSMPDIHGINYVLKDYDGVSAKSGSPPVISIIYSTRHIENSAKESIYKLDFETRGVLYHELVHGYQFEPKGIGSYGTNKEFWACIEGIADAVRAEAGFFDWNTRRAGGHWLDGYRTTGFFIQWLTTKDPDAIRKFHTTVKDLDVWSFDGAIKRVFGDNTGIEGMWKEYQDFLNNNILTEL